MQTVNDSPSVLVTTGGTGLSVLALPFMGDIIARFGLDVQAELERVGLGNGGPAFPVSPSNLNASDLVEALKAAIDDALPYDFPESLRQMLEKSLRLLPLMEKRFISTPERLATDPSLADGLGQLPALGSVAALWQLLQRISLARDIFRQHVEEPLWRTSQGAPTKLRIKSERSKSGGTGGGVSALLEALVVEWLEEIFGDGVQRDVVRIGPDTLMTFNGLGRYVTPNGLMGLLQDLRWMSHRQPMMTKRLWLYTQPAHGRDQAARDEEQAQLVAVHTDTEFEAWFNTQANNSQSANPLSRISIHIPHFFFNVINTRAALASVAKTLLGTLGTDGEKANPADIQVVNTVDEGGAGIEVVMRVISRQNAPAATFDTQVARSYNFTVDIPTVTEFGRSLLDARDIKQIQTWLRRFNALKAGLRKRINELKQLDAPEGDPMETVRALYLEYFRAKDAAAAPTEEPKRWLPSWLSFGGDDEVTEETNVRTEAEVKEDLRRAILTYWDTSKVAQEHVAVIRALEVALEGLDSYLRSNRALDLIGKVRSQLTETSLSGHIPDDLIRVRELTDLFDEDTDTTFYEALLSTVEDQQAFENVLAAMILGPTARGYIWMMKLQDFEPTTVVARLRSPRVTCPNWGGRPQRNAVKVAYFPGLSDEDAEAIQEAAGGEFVIINGAVRASMMGVVVLSISWVETLDDLITGPMVSGIRQALRDPEVWLRYPAYERVDQHLLDMLNEGLRLRGDQKLILPPVLVEILEMDKAAGNGNNQS